MTDERPAKSAVPYLLLEPPLVLPNAKRVLFLGTSHTYYHSLPILTALVAGAPLDPHMIAGPLSALDVHRASQSVQQRLRDEHWDVVVLQDETLRSLHDPVGHESDVAQLCAMTKGTVFLQANWARAHWHACYRDDPVVAGWSVDRLSAALTERAQQVAQRCNIRVSPVARAWQIALKHVQPERLYYRGGNHSNLAGALLTAHVHAAMITGTPTDGLRWRHENSWEISALLAQCAQQAVDELG